MIAAARRTIPARRARQRLRRAALAVVLLAPVVLLLLVLETAPRVPDAGPPDATAAGLSRDLATGLRDLVASDGAGGTWTVAEPALDAALLALHRVLPAMRGDAAVGPDAVGLDVSLGAPALPQGLWLNVHVAVAASGDGLDLAAVRVGRLPLPPGLVLAAARLAADRLAGDRLGTVALAAVAGVATDPPRATLALADDPAVRAALFDRLRARAREVAGADAAKPVHVHLWYLERAARNGALAADGSALDFVLAALQRAHDLATPDTVQAEARGAFAALALACGDGRLGPAFGVAPRAAEGGRCAGTTLGGREDLRRHFVISAGLEAAQTAPRAVGVGELKELLDSTPGGSGFSFDDMAANLAGVRLARTFLDAPLDAWPGLLARLQTEADVLPPLDGLPSGLTESAFRARYGSIDSARYAEVIAEIERRIDALPLHAGRPPG